VHKTARAAPPPPAQLEELIQLHVQGASYTANPPLNVPTVLQLASDGHLNPGRIRRMLAKKARRELRAAGLWDEVRSHAWCFDSLRCVRDMRELVSADGSYGMVLWGAAGAGLHNGSDATGRGRDAQRR
jgi:hypothetical protein